MTKNNIAHLLIQQENYNNIIIPWLLKWEGGFVNDPNDKGGYTNYGISFNKDKSELLKIGIINEVQMKLLTIDQAKLIYKIKYWDPVAKDLCFPMNWVYFNAAVHINKDMANEFYNNSNNDYKLFISNKIL